MRRSSSAARVAEGGASAGEAALPTYDPLSAAGRREAARTRALARAVHCIPVVLLLCAFLLWLSASYHSHLGKVPFTLPLLAMDWRSFPSSQFQRDPEAMLNW